MSTNRWMEKKDVNTTQQLKVFKKDKILLFATRWMNLEGEISQRKKANTAWYHSYRLKTSNANIWKKKK